MFDWDDIRCFKAVARDGSTLAASRALGLDQAIVARRIEALEQALDLELFERGRAGRRLTEAGHVLLSSAEALENWAQTPDPAAAPAPGPAGTTEAGGRPISRGS
ncbi:MAG TPA: LysR family transcriptional regulator [Caulobacteraceae bacterium]